MLSRRQMITGCAVAGATALGTTVKAQEEEAYGITNEQLEALIVAQKLKPTKVDQRFDFAFKASLNGEEWELSMSAVLAG